MADVHKTKEQLVSELEEARQRIIELEALEIKRKRAEEELRRSEEETRKIKESYDRIIDNADEAIFRVDAEGGHVIYANPAAERLFGYSLAEWLADDTLAFRIIHPDFAEKQKRIIREINATKKSIKNAVLGWIAKDGRGIIVEYTIIPVMDEKGEIIYFESIGRDITERKREEEALRESEERYRTLVNLGGKVGEAIVMLQDNEQGNAIQIFVSDEWPRITGYSRKELLGMSFFDLLHPKYQEASLKRHRRKMSGEVIPGLFEMSIIRKDGTEVPIELTSAYTTYKGECANVAFVRDITERKQAVEREKELQHELYLSSRLASIGELAAGVAHEINNPLTGILGFSERLLRKSPDEKVAQGLEIIHSEALRAAKVVQNLLTFAHHRKPQKEYSDINDIVQKALELRVYELKTGNIEVATDLAPGLPQTMVDFHQMQEVFLNILLNAEQAMTEANSGGKLTIKTQEVKGCIRISFADDGPGIPAEQLDKVFDPFFTTRGERGGTGLGLSVCHGIVTEHGGRIYAKSKPGKGATFFVELPLFLPTDIDKH